MTALRKSVHIRWMLVLYDLIILLASDFILLVVYHGTGQLDRSDIAWHVPLLEKNWRI